MKKITLSFIMNALSISCFAQKSVTIKGGTIVPLETVKSVRAIDVHEGESVDFKVSRDVVIDGVVAIPAGTLAKGSV